MNARKLAEGHALIAQGHAKIAEALTEGEAAPQAEPSKVRPRRIRQRSLVGPSAPVAEHKVEDARRNLLRLGVR